jgi:hypothetical protein
MEGKPRPKPKTLIKVVVLLHFRVVVKAKRANTLTDEVTRSGEGVVCGGAAEAVPGRTRLGEVKHVEGEVGVEKRGGVVR